MKTCTGPKLPTSIVTFPGSTAFCDGNSESTILRHAVSLSLFCDLATEDFYYGGDLYFECADVSNEFDRYINRYGLQGAKYVCTQYSSFPASSLPSDVQGVSSASITMDDYWLSDAEQGCFSSAVVKPIAPTPPTGSPVSPYPTSGLPTQAPFDDNSVPSNEPISSPETVPVAVPFGTRSAPPTASDDSSSSVGAIAGGIVAGVAVLAIVAFLFIRKRGTTDNDEKPSGSAANASATESNTDAYTFQGNVSTPASVVAMPYAAQSSGLSTNATSTYVPANSSPLRLSSSATPVPMADSYDVRFKDQSRSVIGPSRASAPMVVPGVPITEAVPIAVAVDGSVASGNTRISIKSEPPGRRMEEP